MITKEAALEDLKKIDVTTSSVGQIIVAVGEILIKMLATIRSNQLLSDSQKVEIQKLKSERTNKK